jgi:hypothetical protein
MAAGVSGSDRSPVDALQERGGLVLQRTDREGANKVALLLAEDVDWGSPAGEVLGAGILIEVLEIEEALDADDPVVHLRVRANDAVRIEREERLSAVDVAAQRSWRTECDPPAGDPLRMTLGDLERWLLERRRELVESDARIRELKEQLRKAHARGYQYRDHPQHATFELLKNEAQHRSDARERLKVLIQTATERVKALRRARTDENQRDYESRFYRAAKRVLTEEQLAAVRLATEAQASGRNTL